MVPPPPGLFSTIAVTLRRACKPVAISRATTSFEPPGVNGTMMRMVLLGKPCAPADEMKASARQQAASRHLIKVLAVAVREAAAYCAVTLLFQRIHPSRQQRRIASDQNRSLASAAFT